MSALLGLRITRHMLDAYLSPSKRKFRLPAAFVAAFCVATHDDSLQRELLDRRNRRLLQLGECAAEILVEQRNTDSLKQRAGESSAIEDKPQLCAV